MVLDRRKGDIEHSRIERLCEKIEDGTIVVLNDTRVLNARIYGTAVDTGGRVEFILLNETQPGLWKSLASKARKQVPGKEFEFPGGVRGVIEAESNSPGQTHSSEAVVAPRDAFRYLRFKPPIDSGYLEAYGHVPLPPYIRREDEPLDSERYQTVYAEKPGSAAAPTAGLHLTEELLRRLQQKGAILAKLTLHVGAGTFLPIRAERIEEHTMHEERYHVPRDTAERINEALSQGRKILAVGTTVVRTLESAYSEELGGIRAGAGRTTLFIYPGYRFNVVSQMLTNFHTPRSSLLVLVCAFAGQEHILDAYRIALREGYRFFSYGDAMLIR